MKRLTLTTCLISAAICWPAPALAEPFGARAERFKTVLDNAGGFLCEGTGGSCFRFNVATYDDSNGQMSGLVEAYNQGTNPPSFVSCEGPAYANAISVNRANGKTTIHATLDPSLPACRSWNGFKFDMRLTGMPSGIRNTVANGTTLTETPDAKTRSKFSSVSFDEVLSGSIGFATGTFTGLVTSVRHTDITREK